MSSGHLLCARIQAVRIRAQFMLGALAPLLRSERVRYPVLRCVAPIAVRVRLLHNCMIWTRASYVRDMSVGSAHQACVPQAARLRKQACLYK